MDRTADFANYADMAERTAVSGSFRRIRRAAGLVVIPVVLIRQNGAE